MPFKEYKCGQCGHEYKRLHFAGEQVENPACPKCGNTRPEQGITCAPPAERSPFLGSEDAPKGCSNPGHS